MNIQQPNKDNTNSVLSEMRVVLEMIEQNLAGYHGRLREVEHNQTESKSKLNAAVESVDRLVGAVDGLRVSIVGGLNGTPGVIDKIKENKENIKELQGWRHSQRKVIDIKKGAIYGGIATVAASIVIAVMSKLLTLL